MYLLKEYCPSDSFFSESACTFIFLLYCKTLLLLLRWDTVKVRDRFDGMVRFKGVKV